MEEYKTMGLGIRYNRAMFHLPIIIYRRAR